MRKITLLCLLIVSSFGFSQPQNWTTDTVNLTSGFTVRFDVNSTTVQVTLVGPNSVGFAVAPTNDVYSGGGGMGQFGGDDVIFFANGTITDRQHIGGNGQPALDTVQNNWTISSNSDNTPSAGSRTIVATRARSTGDANDFIFPNSVNSFTVIWAIGTNAGFTSYHGGGNRGGTVANVVLSNEDFRLNTTRFTISPNPSNRNLNIGITYESSRNYNIEVFDVLGKQIYRGQLTKDDTAIDASNWRSGVYLVKLSSDQATLTKRFIKQ